MVNLTSLFLKAETCGQIVLPDKEYVITYLATFAKDFQTSLFNFYVGFFWVSLQMEKFVKSDGV